MTDCIALAEDGVYFSNTQSFNLHMSANPNLFSVQKGQQVTITDARMLSVGTVGTVVGFDRAGNGTILLLIKWNEKAAPLRVKINAVMVRPPKKFWMVVPLDANRAQGTNQAPVFGSSERRNGNSPAVHRFPSRERAEQYIRDERRMTGFQNYVLLESTAYYTPSSAIAM